MPSTVMIMENAYFSAPPPPKKKKKKEKKSPYKGLTRLVMSYEDNELGRRWFR